MSRNDWLVSYNGTCPFCIRDGKRGQYKKHFKNLWKLYYHCVWNHGNENYKEVIQHLAKNSEGIKIA